MVRWLTLFLVASLTWADAIQVEVRNNEVWLLRNRQPQQLTHDGKAKLQAALSPIGDRIAYDEQCIEGESCTPSIVVLDLQGHRLQAFQPKSAASGQPEPCASILNISWVQGDTILGVECHNNPSLSEYVEVDLATGNPIQTLLGYGFTPSWDGKQIAHVGPIVHFAPPWAQSNYLYINDIVIYPLPKGARPKVEKPFDPLIDVVQVQGSKYIGIHHFVPRFTWSPDSKKVAFIDCVFDWAETGPIGPGGNREGNERNRHCSIAVVSPNGSFALFPLRDVPLDSIDESRLDWVNEQIQIRYSVTKSYKVP